MSELKTVTAREANQRFAKLLSEVEAGGPGYVVTKRGKPVARVEPVAEPGSLKGSVVYLVDDEELLYGTGEIWDMDRP